MTDAVANTAPPRLPVFDRRRAAVLLHPSAFIGGYGGALGRRAFQFVDWLAEAGFSVWQVLPLGPTGADGSPYWARSDRAGNPQLIDPGVEPPGGSAALAAFCRDNAHWLDDYALFEAIGASRGGAPWWSWPEGLRDRNPDALAAAGTALSADIARIRREQWQFDHQWSQLRAHCRSRGVAVLGDLPIYVAPDSATTWVDRSQFRLAPDGQATEVAGVPPDYFSADGQLWGNPLYDWNVMQADGFRFWRDRLSAQLARCDVLRIDHFRGLAAYWSVPAGSPNARNGRWLDAPGAAMLDAVAAEHPDMPLVAEDLGVITPDVDALRRRHRLPGMRVLQFAFDGGADNPHLPHNHERDNVVYSGTHDNDTTAGWVASLGNHTRWRLHEYLDVQGGDPVGAVLRAALASAGLLAVLPMQDLLLLGSEARFNTPGTTHGNWSWRADPAWLTSGLARHYRYLNTLFGRV
jgi:4-alpha-glucanotransferase